MAKLVFGMMQSLDDYVAGAEGRPGLPMPGEALHRHFNAASRGQRPGWRGRDQSDVRSPPDHNPPDTLTSVGPNLSSFPLDCSKSS